MRRKMERLISYFITVLLTFALISAVLPTTVLAAVGEEGSTGIWQWKVLEDNTLSITGCTAATGDLALPASLDIGLEEEVAVTRIENNAFQGDPLFFPSEIETFVMPDSVTSVGDGAFSKCRELKSVTLSQNLKNVGASVFYDCRELTSITIPDSVESIGSEAFSKCIKLVDMTLPDNAKFGHCKHNASEFSHHNR